MAKSLPLEGPKKHHDPHGKDASVPDGRMLPKEHWEMKYDPHPRNQKITPATAFNPHRGQDRPTVYQKVNPTDH